MNWQKIRHPKQYKTLDTLSDIGVPPTDEYRRIYDEYNGNYKNIIDEILRLYDAGLIEISRVSTKTKAEAALMPYRSKK